MDTRNSRPNSNSIFERAPSDDDAKETDVLATPEQAKVEAEKLKAKEAQETQEKAEQNKKQQEDKKKQKEEEQAQEDETAKKRQQAIARSRQLVDEFSDRDHSELNALESVRLIVAERTLWLGARMTEGELPEGESIEAVMQQFDFLSVLADKLAFPELEVRPEIEEVYRRIIEVAAAPELIDDSTVVMPSERVHADTSDDQVLVTLAHKLEHESGSEVTASGEDNDADQSERHNPQSHSAAIAFAVAALALACRRPHHTHRHDDGGGDRYSGPTVNIHKTDASSYSPTGESSSVAVPIPAANAGLSAAAAGTAPFIIRSSGQQYREPARVLESQPLPQEVTAVYPASPPDTLSPTLIEERSAGPTGSLGRTHVPVSARPAFIDAATPHYSSPRIFPDHASAVPYVPADTLPDMPAESWPLHTMLRAAEAIPLGHGQYLRGAFEHGEIDREGLMKVLKDWKKGRDYMPMLAQQRAALANRRAQSPEYLRNTKKQQAANDEDDEKPDTQEPRVESAKKEALQGVTNEVSPIRPSKARETPLSAVTADAKNEPRHFIWALAAMAAVILLGAVLYFVF